MIRTRRRDSGISMVLVVVLILISLILTVVAAGIWADWKAKVRTHAALKAELDVLAAEEAYYRSEIPKLNRATGFDLKEQLFDAGPSITLMKAKRDEYFSAGRLNQYPTDPGEKDKPPKELNEEEKKKFDEARQASTLYDTLQSLVPLAAQRTFLFKNRMEQLQLELDISKEQRTNRETVRPDIPKKKAEEKEKLISRIAEVQKDITRENETFNARKELLNKAKADAEMAAQVEVEKWIEEERRYLNETRELKRQLDDLKVKEVIKHEISFVHGMIVRPDVPNKSAFINIGSQDRVVPGLKFLVGRRGVQGKFEYKGKIEVKKAWREFCEVAIVELYNPKERPIVEGDAIVNPLFSKKRPIVVAFIGEDKPLRLRYSVDEATRRIKEIGSEVRREVSLDLDYVIFTESAAGRQRDHYKPFNDSVFLEIPIAEAGRTKEEPDLPGLFEFLGD